MRQLYYKIIYLVLVLQVIIWTTHGQTGPTTPRTGTGSSSGTTTPPTVTTTSPLPTVTTVPPPTRTVGQPPTTEKPPPAIVPSPTEATEEPTTTKVSTTKPPSAALPVTTLPTAITPPPAEVPLATDSALESIAVNLPESTAKSNAQYGSASNASNTDKKDAKNGTDSDTENGGIGGIVVPLVFCGVILGAVIFITVYLNTRKTESDGNYSNYDRPTDAFFDTEPTIPVIVKQPPTNGPSITVHGKDLSSSRGENFAQPNNNMPPASFGGSLPSPREKQSAFAFDDTDDRSTTVMMPPASSPSGTNSWSSMNFAPSSQDGSFPIMSGNNPSMSSKSISGVQL